jgi:sec-independent protein translocase protein TatA
MGEFSLTHILLLLIVALIFFGPSRLPALGQSLGKAIKGFKDGMNNLHEETNKPMQNEQLANRGNSAPQQTSGQTTEQKHTDKV